MVKKRRKSVRRHPPCDLDASQVDRSRLGSMENGAANQGMVQGHGSLGYQCVACHIRQETIEFLRDQLRQRDMQLDQMQQKLLALVGDAADRYSKMRMMELTAEKPDLMRGVVPIGSESLLGVGMQGDMSDPVNELFNQLERMPRTAVAGENK